MCKCAKGKSAALAPLPPTRQRAWDKLSLRALFLTPLHNIDIEVQPTNAHMTRHLNESSASCANICSFGAFLPFSRAILRCRRSQTAQGRDCPQCLITTCVGTSRGGRTRPHLVVFDCFHLHVMPIRCHHVDKFAGRLALILRQEVLRNPCDPTTNGDMCLTI